jgi:hypothetical protein
LKGFPGDFFILMETIYPYKSLSDTLLGMKTQVRDSLEFADEFLPKRKMTPAEIYSYLKRHVIYFNDPHDRELLQSMPTLFSQKNIHHIYGAGDCDCFTIAALACLFARGHDENFLVISGRNRINAVHVYCKTIFKGKKKTLDLTNHRYDYERFYPYTQELKMSL